MPVSGIHPVRWLKEGVKVDKFIIIGTAGHVDHGKTELVKALTGVDTDRLKEEKERGISIELGFASFPLDSGVVAGIVDVPGHERFVKTMLSGVAGIDLVLLVVAADEGIMPQTLEHLDILELLQIQKGIVVITKIDLVEQDWLLMVRDEVQELLSSTRFKDAPVIPVSSVTGEGLPELRRAIEGVARGLQPKPLTGPARLPVDRVFSITGFGTVLTGTLFSGSIRLGDTLEILPGKRQGRVRSLQVHGKKVDVAFAGQRTAVNLTGIEVGEVSRGDVLAAPGIFPPVRRLTVYLHLLKRAERPLKNWQRVRFHLGTKEVLCRVRLLECEELQPGMNAFAQLELEDLVVAAVHDRFVIRGYSPVVAIGGGEVIEAGGIRYRRYRRDVLERLKRKLSGSPYARAAEELRAQKKPVPVSELASKSGLSKEELGDILNEMLREGAVQLFDHGSDSLVVPSYLIEGWWNEVKRALMSYHKQYPLRSGFPKEELRSRIFKSLSPRLFQSLLEKWVVDGRLMLQEQVLALPDFSVALNQEQEKRLSNALEKLREAPFSPPESERIRELLGGDVDLFYYCIQNGYLVKVSEDLYFLKDAVEQAWNIVKEYLQNRGEITVAEARDLLGTTRKYCLPLLEYFDRIKLTRRLGDKRVLLS